MKTVLMTLSASATAYLTPTALVSASTPADYFCGRYGLGCAEGALPLVARPGTIPVLLMVMAVTAIPALILEARRRR